jgi:hypothetical protein
MTSSLLLLLVFVTPYNHRHPPYTTQQNQNPSTSSSLTNLPASPHENSSNTTTPRTHTHTPPFLPSHHRPRSTPTDSSPPSGSASTRSSSPPCSCCSSAYLSIPLSPMCPGPRLIMPLNRIGRGSTRRGIVMRSSQRRLHCARRRRMSEGLSLRSYYWRHGGCLVRIFIIPRAEMIMVWTDDPALDARLTFIRRQSGLDSRAALFVLSPVSQSELGDFVRRSVRFLFPHFTLKNSRQNSLAPACNKPSMTPPSSTTPPIQNACVVSATNTHTHPINLHPYSGPAPARSGPRGGQ